MKATQPPRPEWWDEGYQHYLSLPPMATTTRRRPAGRGTWAYIAMVRSEIEENYRRS